MSSKRLLSLFLSAGIVLLGNLRTHAQSKYEHNDIFKPLIFWDLRHGTDVQEFTWSETNKVSGDHINGAQKYTYGRTLVDWVHGEWNFTMAKMDNLKLGGSLGLSSSFLFQQVKFEHSRTFDPFGPYTQVDHTFPGGNFGRDDGMDISNNTQFAWDFGLKAGLGIGYNFIPEENLQVSLGYSYRFWAKSNTGAYVLKNNTGGFWDINATYQNWGLNTTFKSNSYDLNYLNMGDVKSSYIMLMPTYVFAKEHSTPLLVGLTYEHASAKASKTITDQYEIKEFNLNASANQFGVFVGMAF